MDRDIIIAFIVFQMTFLFLDMYILMKTNRDIVRQGEFTWFSALTLTHMVYLVLNSIWSLKEYDVIDMSRPALTVMYTISLWTVTNCATSFFLFVVEKLQLKKLRTGAGKWLRQLPAAVATLMLAISPWTGLVFRVSEEGCICRWCSFPACICWPWPRSRQCGCFGNTRRSCAERTERCSSRC